MPLRSLTKITRSDLHRLAKLAESDRRDLFQRRPQTGRVYSRRLFAVALCQGAASHFIDGKTGIKDLDVWSFYRASRVREFPPRRRAKVDFGHPKFGKSVDSPHYVGRRVDLIGRSIEARPSSDPVEVLRQYLRARRTASARCLAKKAMILIEPSHLCGTVAWP